MAASSLKAEIHKQGLPRLFYATALAILIGFLLYVGQSIIIPLVFALFLSFLIVTLKNLIERTPGIGRILPDWMSYILSFVGIASILIILVQIILANASAMLDVFPAYRDRFIEISGAIFNYLSEISFLSQYFVQSAPDTESVESVSTSAVPKMELFAQWQDQAVGVATSFANELGATVRAFGANLVTILLYTCFMLVERGKFLKKLHVIAGPDHDRLDVEQIIEDIGSLVRQYISIKTITSFIVAVVSWVILLMLGVDFAGFWALLIFSFNFIPIIGSIIAVLLPSVLALVQPDGGGIGLFVATIVLLTIAEQVVGSVVEPRLLGKSLNLSPLVILLSLTFWGTLWGFGGMLLCIPITVGIMIVLSQFEDSRAVAVLLSDNGQIAPIKRKSLPTEEATA